MFREIAAPRPGPVLESAGRGRREPGGATGSEPRLGPAGEEEDLLQLSSRMAGS